MTIDAVPDEAAGPGRPFPAASSRLQDLSPTSWRVRLLAVPSSARAARALVRGLCTPMPASAREVAVLLTSELVTNAVRHAVPPIEITVDRHRRGVRVTVTDGHRRRPVLRPLSVGSDNGRGIQLLDGLATAWGVSDRPVGKAVWFYVDHHGPSRSSQLDPTG